jgi:hypothetical protein
MFALEDGDGRGAREGLAVSADIGYFGGLVAGAVEVVLDAKGSVEIAW